MSERVRAVLAAVLIALLVAGCSENFGSQNGTIPPYLNNAPRPLTLIAKNEEGIIIIDANGKLYSYSETYYFAQTIMASEVEVGATIAGN